MAPTGLTPATEEGLSMLRTFQLRKENAILLETIEASAQAIQACTAQNTRFNDDVSERIAALESRLSGISDEEKKNKEAIEGWGTAVRTLKRNIETIIGKDAFSGKMMFRS
jgi:phage shock protein A